jgi:hypothetical protein
VLTGVSRGRRAGSVPRDAGGRAGEAKPGSGCSFCSSFSNRGAESGAAVPEGNVGAGRRSAGGRAARDGTGTSRRGHEDEDEAATGHLGTWLTRWPLLRGGLRRGRRAGGRHWQCHRVGVGVVAVAACLY